ncbi:serine/threonine protein kinase [Paludisphaera mucosa]|uniref:Serine/threonine-protein kinase n=1 Tax=Paludisphaera mucosa TaxID=3030827 RepID=A0ABT6FFC4_9BACT|nr:serine/threonine-protein kinase [Paludisphaera mucosa]MDG3006224.1 serine/threonine-protein kinase [Paludisphaera mucosa]
MIGKLKGMFVTTAAQGGSRRTGVDVQRRFLIQSDVSSQGSMSRVYKAIDSETGKSVCLKVQDREKNEVALARASRHEERPPEGAIAIQIRHPHVARTFEYGTTSRGEQYLVMEYINGISFERIQEEGLGRTAQKLEWLAQAAEGLDAVHRAGFIHHDVNPRNFLVDRGHDHHAKVIDFGLTVPSTPAFRKPGNRTGCLLYMAPELIRREAIDEQIDVFGFGVVAFHFMTGKLPYDVAASPNALLQRFRTPPSDPQAIKAKLSDEVRDVLLKLVAVDKRDRWPSLANLADHLRAIPPKRPLR